MIALKQISHLHMCMNLCRVYYSGASSIPVDYNLYRKFWSLQDFFRRPAQCYDKFAWKTFSSVRRRCFLPSVHVADALELFVLILYSLWL